MQRTKPVWIADLGQAHEGSLGMAHSFIDALAGTGIDAVKFQMHIAEAESSPHEPFRVKFSLEDATRFDYWKRMEFTPEQWRGLKQHCEDAGVEFMCSPFSVAAVELLEQMGVARYKVGSGEISNLLLLDRIAAAGKPVILSSGMSDLAELDRSVEFLKSKNIEVSILQCTTAYPTKPAQYGLNQIAVLTARYGVPTGYSDHSAKVATCIAATALGAEILEFHVVFDRAQFGPDSKSSLTIAEVSLLAESVRDIATALANPVDKDKAEEFAQVKAMFGKSLAVNRELGAGHAISIGDLETKKPSGYGIPASDFETVIGRKLNRPLEKWAFLNEGDLI